VTEPKPSPAAPSDAVDRDAARLHELGYAQELWRRMGGFANFAVSFSIISILTGAITSFDLGLGGAGPAEMGIGWPIVCLFSLFTAMSMAEIASAYPTAGGLYHWAAILGGKTWGWWTAWLNLIGLVTVMAAIDFGAAEFLLNWAAPLAGLDLASMSPAALQALKVAITVVFLVSQAVANHRGIRITALLTELSVWVNLAGAVLLTGALLLLAKKQPFEILFQLENRTGLAGSSFPATPSDLWALVLGFIMAAYTITGYDASAHTAEETMDAQHKVPWGMVIAVVVSSIFGYAMIAAITLAIPNLDEAARSGGTVVYVMNQGLPPALRYLLLTLISLAQYFCGLATVTSLSRMIYAFARDGGLPRSDLWKKVSPRFRTPANAIWLGTGLACLFTIYTPVYSTITAVATISLYVSYGIPPLLGIFARGRTWTQLGPWNLGALGRPIAALAASWIIFISFVLVQPPNRLALWTLLATLAGLGVYWSFARKTFAGPPEGLMGAERQAEIAAAEARLSEPRPARPTRM
jgi:amino acid transporter